jgi:DUF3024 family protein
MALSELAVAKVERFCRQRVPAEALHQVRLEVEVNRNAITIVERRAPWRADYGPEWSRFPIARFRSDTKAGLWTLYWRDRNGRFHRYDQLAPTSSIDEVLDEIARDPTSIFWG